MHGESLSDILSRPAPEALRFFMEHWHGMTAGRNAMSGSDKLPGVLGWFYESYGTASPAFLINRLLPPLEVEDEDGFCVFYVEEQAVYLWGFATEDRDADDPPVWCRENSLGKPWVREAPSVSVFLLQMVMMSAALNGPHGAAAAWLSPEETALALSPFLVEVDLPPWHWPGHPTRWYAGEDAVAFSCSNVGPGHDSLPALSVWVGSLTDGGIRFIEPHLSDAWEYYSPRDS